MKFEMGLVLLKLKLYNSFMRLRWLHLKFFRKDVTVGATGTAGAAGVQKAANNGTAFV